MGGMKISELDFVRLLPVFMRDDQAVKALCTAVNNLIGEPGKRLATIRTWDKIDELTEAECDELAWELDIDWYDSIDMGLHEKRETIKSAQQIKRKRGTKWAVEQLISAYLGEGYIMEWYEMDGSPYTFVVLTTETSIDPEKFQKFVESANASKNERSHILGVFFYWKQDSSVRCGLDVDFHRYNREKCGTRYSTAIVGVDQKSKVEAGIETTGIVYDFRKCGTGIKVTTNTSTAIVGSAIVGNAIVGY